MLQPDIGPDTNPLVHVHGHFEGRTVPTTELVRRGRERPVAVRQVGFESARLLAAGGDEIDISLRGGRRGQRRAGVVDLWDTLFMRDRWRWKAATHQPAWPLPGASTVEDVGCSTNAASTPRR